MDAIHASGILVRPLYPQLMFIHDSPWLPHIPASWTYDFECSIPANKFMHWTIGELRTIRIGKERKVKGKKSYRRYYKEYWIPAPYDRIVCQLVTEDTHAETHSSHESQRRQAYGRETLGAFAKELERLKDHTDAAMVKFRSVVLTPILQRQAWGVHDAYTPCIAAAVKRSHEQLTIQAVTEFYLQADPTDQAHIPSYCRNLLYLPDARWHLGHILGNPSDTTQEGAINYYNMVRAHHDVIMEWLARAGHGEPDQHGFPPLSKPKMCAVLTEGLELFFADELAKQVSCESFFTFSPLTINNIV